jgi:UDP-N-acetylglucosamine--N-acetylmuramyl-(pentapeptide) pyrophosphoryl-undecaprenol N-acetylglucosamine transferase
VSRRSDARTLLVASTGGHLEELLRLRDRLDPPVSDGDWVTFDDPQSRSLLAGEVVHYVDYIPPRGYAQAACAASCAVRLLAGGRYRRVVSTGSGIAIPFLAVARARGVDCHYIESAARAQGPSMTGSVARRLPGVRLYAQYRGWARGPWRYRGSLFDSYQVGERPGSTGRAQRVVVTLGTMRTYGFASAVRRLAEVLPDVLAPDAEVLWQVGATDVRGLGIDAHDRIPAEQMRAAVARADLVVAHAGIGSALTALDAGVCPVLLPRRAARAEHVDDHQLMIADELDAQGLAVSRDAGEVTAEDLRAAMAMSVTAAGDVRPFALG